MGDDAAVDGVERRRDARRDDRRGPTRSGHRVGDQAAAFGSGRVNPVDVEHRDRLADGVDIGPPGGAPEPRGDERHGAIEPGARAEVHRLGDR